MKALIDGFMNGDSEKVNNELNKIILPIKFYLFLLIFLIIICLISNYYIFKNIQTLINN